MKKSILLKDALDLYNAHTELENCEFKLSFTGILNCSKNINELKIINDSFKKSASLSEEQIKELNEGFGVAYRELIDRYAHKDESGNIVYINNDRVSITNINEFKEKVLELKEQYPIAKEKDKKEEEALKHLENEIEVELFPIEILDDGKGMCSKYIGLIGLFNKHELIKVD